MTYKEYYDSLVVAILHQNVRTSNYLRDFNVEWYEQVINDITDTLKKYTMYGIGDE